MTEIDKHKEVLKDMRDAPQCALDMLGYRTKKQKIVADEAARLLDENTKLKAELERVKKAYNELILAVGNKYRGETRHETALKYIKRAEEVNGLGASEAVIEEGDNQGGR